MSKIFETMNGKVAVEPFPDNAVKTTAVGGGGIKVGVIQNKVGLTRLQVVFNSRDRAFRAGDTVLVRSDLYTHPWAKERHEFEGKVFVLMPSNFVEATVSEAVAAGLSKDWTLCGGDVTLASYGE